MILNRLTSQDHQEEWLRIRKSYLTGTDAGTHDQNLLSPDTILGCIFVGTGIIGHILEISTF